MRRSPMPSDRQQNTPTSCGTKRFVLEHTEPRCAPLVPEIVLYLASEAVPLWQATERELEQAGIPAPFWAFAWAGGQALARHLLDYPILIQNKSVFSLAAGSGIEAIAARLAGAARVIANDIDSHALAALALNAELNDVAIDIDPTDQISHPSSTSRETDLPQWDVVLAGDICYEQPMAANALRWLREQAARGSLVLLGDPGRTHLPGQGLQHLASYRVEGTRELEDSDVRRTSVWQVLGDR